MIPDPLQQPTALHRLNLRLFLLTALFAGLTAVVLLVFYAAYTVNSAIKPVDHVDLKDLIRPTVYESLVGIELGDTELANREVLVTEAPDVDVIRASLKQEQTATDVDAPPNGAFLVCDFDKDGVTEREWQCPAGGWVSDPTDPTIRFQEAFDPISRYGNKGYALKLWYDIESPNPGFGGIWIQFKNGSKEQFLDLSDYRTFSMMIKSSSSDQGGTSRIIVEMKNENETGKVTIEGISGKWTRFEIPLRNFKGITNWSRMKEMTVVITPEIADDKEGLLFFDDVMFTR